MNLSGAIIADKTIPTSLEIDISQLPTGLFFMTLKGKDGIVTAKGIKL